MHTNETKTHNGGKRPPPKVSAEAGASPAWRPQPSSLTRAELRQIVIETLG